MTKTNKRVKRSTSNVNAESDGIYFLKLVCVVLLGTFWLKFAAPISVGDVPIAGIPIGLIFGLWLVSHYEHFQTDRKIWYAILIIITILSYFVPAGILV